MRALRDERGGVLVLASVMIPVFLLLTAVVIDVGNWYTHKRQLQNRADAAALAAGIEYAKSWKACVYEGTDVAKLALKRKVSQEIANAARQYAADPEVSDYTFLDPAGPVPATLYNDQIVRQDPDQAKNYLDVVINSRDNDYTDDKDYTDDYDADDSPSEIDPGTPCYRHLSDGTDNLSVVPGHWTDVKVTERDTAALWEPFSPDIHARARVEIRPAISGRRFLPLAIPNNVVEAAQIRYYDECRDPGRTSPLAVKDLAPLPAVDQAAYASAGGGTLWALPKVDGDLSEGDKNRSFHLNLPEYDPGDCSGTGEYLPVGVEVRLTGRSEISLNSSCAFLIAATYADCFTRISQIRVWDDGNPLANPLIKEVQLTGGCATRADAYFGPYSGPQARGSRTCNYGASVSVDFGLRYPTSTDFKVQIDGVDLLAPGADPNGVWTTGGTPLVASTRLQGGKEVGDNDVEVVVSWQPPTGSRKSYSELVHRAYVGTDETAGAVDLVRSSLSSFVSGMPGPAFDNADGKGPLPGCVVRDCEIYPTVAIRSVLKAGSLTVLRTEEPQGSQLLQCDPDVPDGQEFTLFQNGCNPWFGPNKWTSPWWQGSPKACPTKTSWFLNPAPPPYTNSGSNPWRCVLAATGSSVGQTGDWMAVATENCEKLLSNSCATIKPPATANCGNYDGTPSNPSGGWINKPDANAPRVINLFIVPYQALKNVKGASAEIPVLGFAKFYVMNWLGQNSSENDPCPDPDFNGVAYNPPDKGTVIGVFVEAVDYESGPVDPNATCFEGQLTPCRAVLVR